MDLILKNRDRKDDGFPSDSLVEDRVLHALV